MMGGATEHDEAMKWFLNQADGGDILVIRASGSDGYNDYLFTDLGITVNSVETIVWNAPGASTDPYVLQQVANAEAIWMAGGDQWNYVSYWRNNAIDSTINANLNSRNIVIGGTSAGMAVLGGVYFTAENGTVTSTEALSNPHNTDVAISNDPFFDLPILDSVITDTHYDDPDRRGRHMVFLSRMASDWGYRSKGIACDEYTSVCIHPDGKAYVYGDAPQEEDYAYFLQMTCEVPGGPENSTLGNPLTWNRGNQAVHAYRINGDQQGTNYFDLSDWETATGGEWQHWWVDNGTLFTEAGAAPDCSSVGIGEANSSAFRAWPNPTSTLVAINEWRNVPVKLHNISGQEVANLQTNGSGRLAVTDIPAGFYVATSTSHPGTAIRIAIVRDEY